MLVDGPLRASKSGGSSWAVSLGTNRLATELQSSKDRIEGNVGLEQLGDRAASLCLSSELFEGRTIRARNFRVQSQVDRGDRVTAIDLLQGNLGRSAHLLGGELRLAQHQRQSHREAACMGGSDQLLGIAAALPLEP